MCNNPGQHPETSDFSLLVIWNQRIWTLSSGERNTMPTYWIAAWHNRYSVYWIPDEERVLINKRQRRRERPCMEKLVLTVYRVSHKAKELPWLSILLWNTAILHFNKEPLLQHSSPRVPWGSACCSISDGRILEGCVIPLIACLKSFVRAEWQWSGTIRTVMKSHRYKRKHAIVTVCLAGSWHVTPWVI